MLAAGQQVAGRKRCTTRGHHDPTSHRLLRRAEGTSSATLDHLPNNQHKKRGLTERTRNCSPPSKTMSSLPSRPRRSLTCFVFSGFSIDEKRLRSEKTGIRFNIAVAGSLDSRGSHKTSFILGARSGSSRIRSICQGSANENQVVTSGTAPDPRGGSARSKALKGRNQPRSGGSPTFCRSLLLLRPSGPNQIPPPLVSSTPH